MKTIKKGSLALIVVAVLLLAVFLQGCSGGGSPKEGTEEPGQEAKEPVMLRAVSGASGGLWQIYGTAWAQIVEKYNENIKIQVEAVGGGYANIVSVNEDPTCLGMTQNAAAYEGVRGLNWARARNTKTSEPCSRFIRAACISASGKSGIKIVKDFEGKVVSVGQAGGTDTNVKGLFGMLGLNRKSLLTRTFLIWYRP